MRQRFPRRFRPDLPMEREELEPVALLNRPAASARARIPGLRPPPREHTQVGFDGCARTEDCPIELADAVRTMTMLAKRPRTSVEEMQHADEVAAQRPAKVVEEVATIALKPVLVWQHHTEGPVDVGVEVFVKRNARSKFSHLRESGREVVGQLNQDPELVDGPPTVDDLKGARHNNALSSGIDPKARKPRGDLVLKLVEQLRTLKVPGRHVIVLHGRVGCTTDFVAA